MEFCRAVCFSILFLAVFSGLVKGREKISGGSGEIKSPNFDIGGEYGKTANCSWEFNPPANRKKYALVLTVTQMKLYVVKGGNKHCLGSYNLAINHEQTKCDIYVHGPVAYYGGTVPANYFCNAYYGSPTCANISEIQGCEILQQTTYPVSVSYFSDGRTDSDATSSNMYFKISYEFIECPEEPTTTSYTGTTTTKLATTTTKPATTTSKPPTTTSKPATSTTKPATTTTTPATTTTKPATTTPKPATTTSKPATTTSKSATTTFKPATTTSTPSPSNPVTIEPTSTPVSTKTIVEPTKTGAMQTPDGAEEATFVSSMDTTPTDQNMAVIIAAVAGAVGGGGGVIVIGGIVLIVVVWKRKQKARSAKSQELPLNDTTTTRTSKSDQSEAATYENVGVQSRVTVETIPSGTAANPDPLYEVMSKSHLTPQPAHLSGDEGYAQISGPSVAHTYSNVDGATGTNQSESRLYSVIL